MLWPGLAKIFNDYKHFRPNHICPEDPHIGHLNPNTRRRPQWQGLAISKRFRQLKSSYTVALQRHHRSGHHSGVDNEERADFWQRACNGDQVLYYAFCAWKNEVDLEFVSRLAEGGFESGLQSCVSVAEQPQTPRKQPSKRKSMGERLIQVIEQTSTPPDIKRARDVEGADAMRQIASAMSEDVAIKREKLDFSRRARLVEDLTKALQTPGLTQATKTMLEEKLIAAFNAEESNAAVQMVGCTITNQHNSL